MKSCARKSKTRMKCSCKTIFHHFQSPLHWPKMKLFHSLTFQPFLEIWVKSPLKMKTFQLWISTFCTQCAKLIRTGPIWMNLGARTKWWFMLLIQEVEDIIPVIQVKAKMNLLASNPAAISGPTKLATTWNQSWMWCALLVVVEKVTMTCGM